MCWCSFINMWALPTGMHWVQYTMPITHSNHWFIRIIHGLPKGFPAQWRNMLDRANALHNSMHQPAVQCVRNRPSKKHRWFIVYLQSSHICRQIFVDLKKIISHYSNQSSWFKPASRLPTAHDLELNISFSKLQKHSVSYYLVSGTKQPFQWYVFHLINFYLAYNSQ